MNNTGKQFISASLLLLWLFTCAGPPEKQAIKEKLFKTHTLEFSNSNLHFVTSGSSDNQPILFIHGTPGDWNSFTDLMQTETMQENFYMFSIDRLGWGKSTIQNKNIEARFKPHTDAINTLLRDIINSTGKKVIVAGHSLGGTLAPMVAIESSDYVKTLVILAGDLDPRFGEPRWYNRFADLAFIKWLLPEDLKKANAEIMPLKHEMLMMAERYLEIKVPITIIHGVKDKLVSFDNVAYAEQTFAHLGNDLTIVPIENAGHFIIWENINVITNELIKFLN